MKVEANQLVELDVIAMGLGDERGIVVGVEELEGKIFIAVEYFDQIMYFGFLPGECVQRMTDQSFIELREQFAIRALKRGHHR